ncbi:aminotransferase class III-fold pyridoxal phosphate-dependent enzyme [Pontivivens insulae]|uniref:3-aminobutyryl-CoA aminotransferase n=1 Tax=Pontivivens insulae TaxID=1639689 RepID=A0A2R8A7I1_9RHOB|nr:aminotransferase class III-fold pyridoxal phosphate-dependent enzyme [Pontivivens insulae]RED18293.1 glutamate-1-semialdehyde 2,1-aminomutase [Pontivivens insulae]SPF28191.1 3-aminobutyryl-CoA aminotransferase [Pontivivens insulae]
MKTVAIIQARMGSTRLPGKVMKLLGNTPAIGVLYERLKTCKNIDGIVLATSALPREEPLVAYSQKQGISIYRGDEIDVLGRYHNAARLAEADVILRITGDCPLVDPALTDEMIEAFMSANVDYYSNTQPPVFPDGLDVEIFSMAALGRAFVETDLSHHREHVTPYLREDPGFRRATHPCNTDNSDLRITLDEAADLRALDQIVKAFHPRLDMGWREIVSYLRKNSLENQVIERNEGSNMGSGQKLWQRARQIIPGGNMLLSKRGEMTLPELWPSYFSKTDGATVWDMDGVEYLDMGVMGVGTNTLGYSHPEVDAVVMDVVRSGNMSTLNAPEEVYLAERLIDMHPFAEMARFARSGGEANAIAVRIGRAAAGRDGVAICGYHGWHDWYLSTNLTRSDSLGDHLLSGLSTDGVPKGLTGLTHPFLYNQIEQLEEIVRTQEIGVIKMEVARNFEPQNDFLQKVRSLATRHGIVLIFDECTSGFRQSFGGLHKVYGVEPDIAVFGKTLGNGYAVSAVIGRSEVMQAAQNTFISSTFWTERIGSAAGLRTLDVMEREKSWEYITARGGEISRLWADLAERNGLKIETSGLPALSSFDFINDQARACKTYLAQAMLEDGILGSSSFFASMAHTDAHVERYGQSIDRIFQTISQDLAEGRPVENRLRGPLCHTGFKRLN